MAVPKFEDFKAPWETDTEGKEIPAEEQKIDKGKLKKYLHGLLGDKDRAQVKATEETAKVATVAAERDALKKAADDLAHKDDTEVQKLQSSIKALEEKIAKGDVTSAETLRYRVALEKGLTAKQAKRLVGTTEAELTADADELLEDLGVRAEVDDEGKPLRHQPVRKLKSAGDPDPDADDTPITQALIDSIPRN